MGEVIQFPKPMGSAEPPSETPDAPWCRSGGDPIQRLIDIDREAKARVALERWFKAFGGDDGGAA